jgi:hypothetical protein
MWMEVAIVAIIFAVGNIVFGHWEEQTPKWRRLLKFVLVLGVTLALSAGLGRSWAFGFLGALGVLAVIVHGWWLPRQGINGWTGEPKEKYYAMRGWKYPPSRG